jgi:hypothetical protein
MHEWPILVISSGARDLEFSATCKEKISRLRLEMTIATQSLEGGKGEGEFLCCPATVRATKAARKQPLSELGRRMGRRGE